MCKELHSLSALVSAMLIEDRSQVLFSGAILASVAWGVLMARLVLRRRVSPRRVPWPVFQLSATVLLVYFCMVMPAICLPGDGRVIQLARGALAAGCILLAGGLVGTLLTFSRGNGDSLNLIARVSNWGAWIAALAAFLFFLL
jgi:hypothetical protein